MESSIIQDTIDYDAIEAKILQQKQSLAPVIQKLDDQVPNLVPINPLRNVSNASNVSNVSNVSSLDDWINKLATLESSTPTLDTLKKSRTSNVDFSNVGLTNVGLTNVGLKVSKYQETDEDFMINFWDESLNQKPGQLGQREPRGRSGHSKFWKSDHDFDTEDKNIETIFVEDEYEIPSIISPISETKNSKSTNMQFDEIIGSLDNMGTVVDTIQENQSEIENHLETIDKRTNNMRVTQKDMVKDIEIINNKQSMMLKMLEIIAINQKEMLAALTSRH
jgi:hypothetical protein